MCAIVDQRWGQYPAILNKQAWLIQDLLYDQKQRLTFSCEEEEDHPKSILPPWVANKNAGFISSCPLMELAIFKWINPFAPGDFTKKRVLTLVEWFSGPVVLWRATTHHKAVYRSYNSLPSDGMHRKQNFEVVFEFKSETAVLTFTFRFLSSPFFRFSCLMLFFSCWALVGFILGANVFRKALRILGWDERRGRRVVERDFHGNFQVNVTWLFCLFLAPVSLNELCSFWCGLKDLFTLHKFFGQSCPRPFK